MRYIAVRGQDWGTCEQLQWAATSVDVFVLARGDDADDVLSRGQEAFAPYEGVRVFDLETRTEVRWDD